MRIALVVEVGTGQCLGSAALGAHTPEPVVLGRREDDYPVASPGSAARNSRGRERHRRTSRPRDLFHTSAREEPDPVSVRREERSGRPLCSRQLGGLFGLIQPEELNSFLLGYRTGYASRVPSGEMAMLVPGPLVVMGNDTSGPKSTSSRISGRSAGFAGENARGPATERSPRRSRARRMPPKAIFPLATLLRRRLPSGTGFFSTLELDARVADVAQPLAGSFQGSAAEARAPRRRLRRQRRPVGLAPDDRRDRVRDGLAANGARPSASRRARSRTPRCRCACRPPCRAPAPGSCRRRCRGSRRCGAADGRVGECEAILRRRPPSTPSPGRSRAPSPPVRA